MRIFVRVSILLILVGVLNSCGLVSGVAKPILRTVGAAGRVVTGG